MKMAVFLGIVVMPILAGCVATPDYQQILTKDEYTTKVVGRSINLKDTATTVSHADGTMTGNTPDGREIEGQWTWEDGKYCREGTVGTDVLERDCQKMEIADDKMRFTRGDGSTGIVELN